MPDDKVLYIDFPIRFRPDARSKVELDCGAALDAVEAAQFDLDDFVRVFLEDAGNSKQPRTHIPAAVQLDGIRALSWARHHAYLTWLPLSRVFEQIVRDGSAYLGDVSSLNGARGEVRQMLDRVNAIKGHLVTFSRVLGEVLNGFVHAGDASDGVWKNARLSGYTELLRRWDTVAEKLEILLLSLDAEVARIGGSST